MQVVPPRPALCRSGDRAAEYGHAYGGFGVSLALIAAVSIIASFWVWIAAVMGVYWERKAGPAAVTAMEELSSEASK